MNLIIDYKSRALSKLNKIQKMWGYFVSCFYESYLAEFKYKIILIIFFSMIRLINVSNI